MYKLFYYPRNASWAPHMVLKEMGVAFELELVDRKREQQKTMAYMQLNPTGRIPTLVDGDLVMHESAAICLHLCEKHPQAGLIPEVASPNRALFYQWLFYLNSTVQPELMVYFYPQKHTTSDNTAAIKQAQEARVTDMFAFIDSKLEGKEYLVGSSLTVCDYFLFMLAHWASGFNKPPLGYKHLGGYLRMLAKREAVMAVSSSEGTDLTAYI
ncbi:glutathione S-transferase family protein [Saccharophagus degradans]|uniref:Glutathione S-transferase-like protein n=1 Tax=Saccharophagus degradans (strain 2-40 / ATCC 43961 / DSM 17024) TaxID=203122 RepID=Q21GE3_SACD2|nr:glutathione S-transferase family protein [Saccharophagus degradans]ABD82236.1 glutathione S-transferase-like protein [Saccharophagus degradans 2-40]